MKDLHNPLCDRLFEAILNMEDTEECYRFFEDLCTVRELEDLSQRLQVAELLDRGISYNEISKTTGASTTTISRVSKCLLYGAGGYREALDKLKKAEEK